MCTKNVSRERIPELCTPRKLHARYLTSDRNHHNDQHVKTSTDENTFPPNFSMAHGSANLCKVMPVNLIRAPPPLVLPFSREVNTLHLKHRAF
ncbi:hypothetical protein E2C01_087122 [Portunus trituberculatus]|uniref:Uncharacterized protein n=1 Tax=Portunus trituberculatus TaxID=210409 RepID=A0A5B7J5R6_PORTR|nr:hypothetical protein [Portunus trituberculatus]